MSTVFAAAGRRIDPLDVARPSFPLSHVALVAHRVSSFLRHHDAKAVVVSAACGADLIMLDEAGRLGIPRRVILPFDPTRFRAKSVTDRPGDWGPLYDRVIADVSRQNELVISAPAANELAGYLAVNHLILEGARSAARKLGTTAAAVLIWDCLPHAADDLTSAFGEAAQDSGMDVLEISTLL